MSSNQIKNKFKSINSVLRIIATDVFTYSTIRSTSVQSLKVGIIYRSVQLLLLSYIIGWELIHNKNYQQFDSVSSVVTTKVKGHGFLPIREKLIADNAKNNSDFYHELFLIKQHKNYKIIDTADYIIPANEYNSIFIMTNFIETVQIQGVCDEDSDCKKIEPYENSWNGIPTGHCIRSSIKKSIKVCEVKGWCPTEHYLDRREDNIIRNVFNYTIFIKNDIEFKRLNKKERNILPNITNNYISKCNYQDDLDELCPVFQIDYILKKAEPNETERYIMMIKGGVISIEIIWNCDYDAFSTCLPKYNFKRFDLPFSATSTASGFNFRYAHKFKDGDKQYRILYKAFGLRLIINVSGTGGQFNIVPLMLSIGAGLGLMSISVLIADCVLIHCTARDRTFFNKKQNNITDEMNVIDASITIRI